MTVLFIAVHVSAQNPTFGGEEFRQVWVDGTLPAGATNEPTISGSTQFYLTPAGLYMNSTLYGNGLYFIDDSGGYMIATTAQPEFDGSLYFYVMGSKPDGSMLFCPVVIGDPLPCQLYDASGLHTISSPAPEQAINLGNYFDGRMAYLTASGSSGSKIWYYSEGNPAELWLDNTDVTNLATLLDYDGESLAFCASVAGGYDVWKRAPDGTLSRIIGPGDPMPGDEAYMFTGTPNDGITEVDQGKVYLMTHGAGSSTRVLFSSADGITFDIIAKRYEAIPGQGVTTIDDMWLQQVRDGKIWLLVDQSDGDKVLYQIVNGAWTRVAGQNDSYDGRTAVGFEAFEHGMLGDHVAIAVSFLDFSSPTFYTTEIYVNADLPGFTTAVGGATMSIRQEAGGDWKIMAMGEAGATNTLQATSSLTNSVWDTEGTVVADGSGLMEWPMSPTNDAQFFRLVK